MNTPRFTDPFGRGELSLQALAQWIREHDEFARALAGLDVGRNSRLRIVWVHGSPHIVLDGDQAADTGLREFVVLQEFDDYLLCTPFIAPADGSVQVYDPNLGRDEASGSEDFPADWVLVAKPYELQRTPFDGQTVYYEDEGEDWTYAYTGIGQRTATDTDATPGSVDASGSTGPSGSETGSRQEIISPGYFAGTILECFPGTFPITFEGGGDGEGSPTDGPALWMDANTAGRNWLAVPVPDDDPVGITTSLQVVVPVITCEGGMIVYETVTMYFVKGLLVGVG